MVQPEQLGAEGSPQGSPRASKGRGSSRFELEEALSAACLKPKGPSFPLPILEVEGLSVRVAGRRLFEPLTFRLAPGECLAVMGPSGTGKSLLLRALAGAPPAGVRVEGTVRLGEVSLWPSETQRRTGRPSKGGRGPVGWVPQHAARCFDPLLTIGTHLRQVLPSSDGSSQRQPLLRRLWRWRHLSEREGRPDIRTAGWLDALALPPSVADQYARELSGGMARRAALAWCLASQAPLILADEPTTGADALRLLELTDLIRAVLLQGRGVVLVTHEPGVAAALAARTLMLTPARVSVVNHHALQPHGFQEPPVLASSRAEQLLLGTSAAREPFCLRGLGLTCQWPGQLSPLFRSVSLELKSGGWYGLTGLSGSGKSTLAKVLAGLIHPQAGAVEVAGPSWVLGGKEPARRPHWPEHLAGRKDALWWSTLHGALAPEGYGCLVQLVLQEPTAAGHPAVTVMEALNETLEAFPPRVPRRAVPALLSALLARAGLQACVHTPVGCLSGGELRRLGLLRALLARPALLILDEPTAGLDTKTARQILGLVQEAVGCGLEQDPPEAPRDAPAVLIVSHDLGLLRSCCSTLLLLEEGAGLQEFPVLAWDAARRHSPLLDRLLDAWEVLNP